MNSARRVLFSLLLAGSPIISAHANPAPLDEARLVQCMLEHTTSNDEVVFKDMMVATLNDDSGALKSSLVQLHVSLNRIRFKDKSMQHFKVLQRPLRSHETRGAVGASLARTKCDVGMSALATPSFQVAAKLYGQQIGEKLMKEGL